MITIEINNSYSRVTGLSPAQERKLRDDLSYTVGGASAYFSGFGPKRRSLLDKKGSFPTGLLRRVNFGSQAVIKDLRKRPIKPLQQCTLPVGIVPYAAQLQACNEALKHGRAAINMPTGTGKALVVAMLASSIPGKVLIVVPNLELKRQLSETTKYLKNVVVENIDSPNLARLTNFDGLIIDEAHHGASKTYRKLNKSSWTGIYYRFYLSATMFRNDDEEALLLESIVGPVVYSLSYKTAVNQGYIVPVEAYFIDVPKQDTDAYTYQQVYSRLVVNNQIRNNIITKLLKSLENTVHTLVLVKEVAHGEILSDLSGVPFVSGADDSSRDYIRQFNSGEIMAVIGTTGILGEGIDTKPCEYVLVASPGKAKSQFMQQIGRSIRTYPGKESAKVVLFRDKSHKFLLRHFNAQRKVLKDEYGVTPVKLEIGDL